ncbi:MAG TPA: sigma-70 family RNA polymerase sigma factor [Mucilaginibacter sp.]
MQQQELIPHLFRTEFSKITAVLGKLFGFEHIEIAEDIASDTFLLASETWGLKGLPENPAAWLYTVAKNKAKDYLRRNKLFTEKITAEIQYTKTELHEIDIDLSDTNIIDSQLQMMFAICQPGVPAEAQIGLSLRILCGFGIEEIANAFLSNKETINKRLLRAKAKLREENVKIAFPPASEIEKRLETVLTTLYLLFNEGYYSLSQNTTVRKDLCLEAMRLCYLLTINESTNKPQVNALLALMCFHASRFEARVDQSGEQVLYADQDIGLWDQELIERGKFFLDRAAAGTTLSKFHIEAGLALQHTIHKDTPEKWERILHLYNKLLIIEYSPMAALNRAYAVAKAQGKPAAIIQAEKLKLTNNHLYYNLLGYLYTGIDNQKAIGHLKTALTLAKTKADKVTIEKSIRKIKGI